MDKCSACGCKDMPLRGSLWHSTPICSPCFIVWYDPCEQIDMTDPEQVGALSRKLRQQGKFPWDGTYKPLPEPYGDDI
jgi:hypothetical protein